MNMEMMKRNLRERRQFLNFGFAFHRGARHNTFISLCSWLEGEVGRLLVKNVGSGKERKGENLQGRKVEMNEETEKGRIGISKRERKKSG